MKKTILKAVAKAGKQMAVKACGNASYYGYHQPKEPKALKELAK
ncbi:MAG: cyclic lactone autoinducer peptide [Ruminococcus sp.]|nr:cyclic lactone autoinducer peptide [Ruminococcus sp.]